MNTTWKANMAETKQHYIDWWNGRGIVLNMWEHFQQGVAPHAEVAAPPAPKDLNQKWFDPEWRAAYLDWQVAHSSLKADILPVANTQLGPGSLAAILGGVFEGGEDTIWIHPDPRYTDDLRFDEQHPNWLLHKALLRACKERAQGHYYVGMPDLMEGLDVLAALKGTDKVLLDTVMQPEVLEAQMQRINEIYFRVFDELYEIIREGDEMAFCYFSAWAPGRMSKLQCDLSTMIGTDDYRRFVQPFLREQCRRIDYTLYHLDGVGALRHLPALLEIEELNAVQWTPGVGEPQGGSPKWYGLYRQILDAGKSVMACWVQLDELRPLLDHIGGEGVHIEMDFHNEAEVEEALRIVEEYRSPAPAAPSEERVITLRTADAEVSRIIDAVEREHAASAAPRPTLAEAARGRILVLDGALGTTVQRYGLTEADFRGDRFADHPKTLKGCNDLLALTRPEILSAIHAQYLEAGADLIETNTFNAQRISMADYGLADRCREINAAACRIARTLADEYTRRTPGKPRYVLGSVGPTNKTVSIAAEPAAGEEPFSVERLRAAYDEQIETLLDGGVDALLIETIFDTRNARVALDAARSAMRRSGRRVPVLLSFTVATADGHNMLGQSVEEFIASLDGEEIFSVGLNCSLDIEHMIPLLQRLGARFPYRISAYPNAGHPDAAGHYGLSPEAMQRALWPLIEGHAVDILGGCCGTTDRHIRKIAEAVQPIAGLFVTPHHEAALPAFHLPGPVTPPAAPSSPTTPSAGESGEAAAPKESAPCSLFEAILDGKAEAAVEATCSLLDAGAEPQAIINDEMIRAMSEVGRRFQEGKAFVPQLLMAGRAMKAALERIKPLLAGRSAATAGRVVIGTVKGDLHDIGKNLVASMLEGCGFEVVNIGIDVPAERFVEAVRTHRADILCLSALLTTTMTQMREVIGALEAAGMRRQVKVMVGGAPVTQAFADEIGADGYSDNANTAVAVAKRLMQRPA